MRISDWSSDVCSSDLGVRRLPREPARGSAFSARFAGCRWLLAASPDALCRGRREGLRDPCVLGPLRGGTPGAGRGLRRGGVAPDRLGARQAAGERLGRRLLPQRRLPAADAPPPLLPAWRGGGPPPVRPAPPSGRRPPG